jgi:UDP-N-acetylmuramate--alanine ligase
MPGVTSDLIADVMREAGRPPHWRGECAALASALAGDLAPADLIVTMGAGDVTRVGPALLAALGAAAR